MSFKNACCFSFLFNFLAFLILTITLEMKEICFFLILWKTIYNGILFDS